MSLRFEYDGASDVFTIEGIRYDGHLLRTFGIAQPGAAFRVEANAEGVLTLRDVREDLERVEDRVEEARAVARSAEEQRHQQEQAAQALIAALVDRCGGSATLLESDVKAALRLQLVRERLGGGAGIRFRTTRPAKDPKPKGTHSAP